jgi:Na+-transporting NADH:ubiquinone oxidoreductase subunit NqrB
MRRFRQFFADPRHGQIAALAGLVVLGMAALAFEMPWWRPATACGTALLLQYGIARLMRLPFDWRSPLISALSLTLLLRTDGPFLVAVAAAIAIASKALVRIDGRHLFNPTALGIALTASLFPGAWVSPGQWGSAGLAAAFAVGAGLAVTYGARRLEVPLSFLAFWAALCFGRAAMLGDPAAIPLHQMSSGALVIFAFFMISDPMTSPWHPAARIGWTGLVALSGFLLQTGWVVAAGPIYGLVAMAPLVPLLNRLFPAPRFAWRPHLPKGPSPCAPSS